MPKLIEIDLKKENLKFLEENIRNHKMGDQIKYKKFIMLWIMKKYGRYDNAFVVEESLRRFKIKIGTTTINNWKKRYGKGKRKELLTENPKKSKIITTEVVEKIKEYFINCDEKTTLRNICDKINIDFPKVNYPILYYYVNDNLKKELKAFKIRKKELVQAKK